MSILVNKSTRVICQGITGAAGSFHTDQCLAYGSTFVGGVTPKKGGTTWAGKESGRSLPVFNTVAEAVAKTGSDATMIFVPAGGAADASMEAADAGVRIIGTTQIDLLELFEKDPGTHAILMIGEIGGTAEERAAEYVAGHVTKPVAAFIAGQTAPPGRRMGHAGAIISGGSGTAAEKIAALKAAGIAVAESPADLGVTVQRAMRAKPTGSSVRSAGHNPRPR